MAELEFTRQLGSEPGLHPSAQSLQGLLVCRQYIKRSYGLRHPSTVGTMNLHAWIVSYHWIIKYLQSVDFVYCCGSKMLLRDARNVRHVLLLS